jgi:hypothetical protein
VISIVKMGISSIGGRLYSRQGKHVFYGRDNTILMPRNDRRLFLFVCVSNKGKLTNLAEVVLQAPSIHQSSECFDMVPIFAILHYRGTYRGRLV